MPIICIKRDSSSDPLLLHYYFKICIEFFVSSNLIQSCSCASVLGLILIGPLRTLKAGFGSEGKRQMLKEGNLFSQATMMLDGCTMSLMI